MQITLVFIVKFIIVFFIVILFVIVFVLIVLIVSVFIVIHKITPLSNVLFTFCGVIILYSILKIFLAFLAVIVKMFSGVVPRISAIFCAVYFIIPE